MRERPAFVRTWLRLFAMHVVLAAIAAGVLEIDPPAWLRNPLGSFATFSIYAPISVASRLGAPRSMFERTHWLLGDLTPAGWVLVVGAWLLVHAAMAAVIIAIRRKRARANAIR